MFILYLNTLHRHHEKTLALGKRSSDTYLAVLSNMVDGQFRMAMAMLHPIISNANAAQPIAHWEYLPNAENHKHLAMHWLTENKEKLDEFNHVLLAMVEHHTSGWSVIANEFLTKLQADAAPEFKELLGLGKATVEQLAATESAAMLAVKNATSVEPVKLAQKQRRVSEVKVEAGE